MSVVSHHQNAKSLQPKISWVRGRPCPPSPHWCWRPCVVMAITAIPAAAVVIVNYINIYGVLLVVITVIWCLGSALIKIILVKLSKKSGYVFLQFNFSNLHLLLMLWLVKLATFMMLSHVSTYFILYSIYAKWDKTLVTFENYGSSFILHIGWL